jgi:translation initiation factor 4G
MTSAPTQTDSSTVQTSLSSATLNDATSPSSGVVPAPLPRSNASALKTASPNTALPAGASLPQNAQPGSAPVNGVSMAQGGPQSGTVPNGTPSSGGDHGRKVSVVIGRDGASGYPPNGGPVNNGRASNISFGSINQSSPLPAASVPHSSQTSSLATPQANPRTTTPTHSPSPIPQPPASGGRPPSSLQNQSNGMQFGSMGGDSDQVCDGLARDLHSFIHSFIH